MSKVKVKTGSVVRGLAAFEQTLDKAFKLADEHPELLPGHGEEEGNPITLAPRIPEAADMANKMVTNAAAAAEAWLQGVLKPKKDPIVQAKKSNAKYKQKVTESLQNDSYLKGLENIDETEMYDIIRAGGSAVFSGGIERRKGKITKKLEKMRPLLLALTATLDAMPDATDTQREQKMIAARRGMIAIGKKMKGIT